MKLGTEFLQTNYDGFLWRNKSKLKSSWQHISCIAMGTSHTRLKNMLTTLDQHKTLKWQMPLERLLFLFLWNNEIKCQPSYLQSLYIKLTQTEDVCDVNLPIVGVRHLPEGSCRRLFWTELVFALVSASLVYLSKDNIWIYYRTRDWLIYSSSPFKTFHWTENVLSINISS